MKLQTEICGISFKNPIIAASGTFGFGEEFEKFYPLSTLGGISVKGLTPERRDGNPSPRIAETPMGILNSVGLQNPGIDAFEVLYREKLSKEDTVIIANVAGKTVEEYCYMAERVDAMGIAVTELNISCPNVKSGGVAFGATPQGVETVTSAVRKHCKNKLMVKLSPNTADIAENARAAEAAGADAVSLINTLTGMAIDLRTRRPILANITGGMSGPAVKPVALRMVWQCSKAVSIPVVGMGGIMTGTDVVEFLLAGASAVMVGTANLADPMACPRILDELKEYMRLNGIDSIKELIGGLRV